MEAFSLWHLIILASVAYVFYRIASRKSRQQPPSVVRAPDGITPGEAELIVNAYGKTLEHLGPIPGSTVADENKLPFPKGKIKAALLVALKFAISNEQRAVLKNSFLFLADFQTGVGTQNVGLDLTKVDVNKLDDAALLEMAKDISGNSDMREKWLAQAHAEREMLERQLIAAGF